MTLGCFIAGEADAMTFQDLQAAGIRYIDFNGKSSMCFPINTFLTFAM